MTVATASPTSAIRASGSLFVVNGLLMASWVSRIPAVRDRLHASTGGLGAALLCTGLGSLVAMPFSGRLVDRFGSRLVVAGCVVAAAVEYPLIGLVRTLPELGGVLLILGASIGVWDVAMNVQAHQVERVSGRPIMSRFHAGWSTGSILGAGVGALAVRARLGPGAHLATAAVGCAVVALLSLRAYLPDDHDGSPAARAAHGRLLSRRLLTIGLMCFAAACAEGAANDWSALFVVDRRHAPQALGALGFAVFATAMALGRAAGTSAVQRLGRVTTLRLGGVVAAVGVVVTLTVPYLGATYLGMLLWGIGLSAGFPLSMSAAGDTPGRGADAIAAVSVIGYGGFLVGPPLIGTLAQATNLSVALWVVVVLAVVMALAAASTRELAAAGG